MGIHGNFESVLKADPKCKDAIDVDYKPMDLGGTVIVDGAPLLFTLSHPRTHSRQLVMPDELNAAWNENIQSTLVLQGVRHYIICCDIPSLVPKQKKATQMKRDEQAAKRAHHEGALPYPEGTLLTLDGVIEPGCPLESILDLDRLTMSPRSVRRQLWPLVFELMVQYSFEPDRYVLYDFEKGGPYLFHHGTVTHLDGLAHKFGEADLMIPFYMRYFRYQKEIVIHSADSDVMILILNYLRSVGKDQRHQAIYLQRMSANKKAKKYYDMIKLHEVLGDRLFRFQVLAMTAGTDYIEKKQLTHMIGDQFIWEKAVTQAPFKWPFEARFDLSSLLNNQPGLWKAPLCDPYLLPDKKATTAGNVEARKILETTIQNLYNEYNKQVPTTSLATTSQRKPVTRKAKPPTEVPLTALTAWAYNLTYWWVNWLAIKREASADFALSGTTS